MNIWQSVAQWREKRARRKIVEGLLKKQGCACFCSQCNKPLEGEATPLSDGDTYSYQCPCGAESFFNYGIGPAPLLADSQGRPLVGVITQA